MPNSSQYPRHDGSKGPVPGARFRVPAAAAATTRDDFLAGYRVSANSRAGLWIKDHLDAAFYSGIDEHSRPRGHHRIL